MRPRRGDAASIIDANTHYSVQIQRSGIGEDNDVEVADERMFFYVLAVRTHLQNPKVMPIHSSVSGKACLRLNVQYMDVWKAAGYDLDGVAACVYPEVDPVWIDVLDVAPFQRMQSSLRRWKDSPSDRAMCFDLSEPVLATPRFAITDERCPVLSVRGHLHALGWIAHVGDFVHTTGADKRFDGRDPRAHKQYFQVLLRIDDIVSRNVGGVHSGQPQSYYKLLLMDQTVQPDLGDLEYATRLADLKGVQAPKARAKRPIAALAVEDDMDVVGGNALPVRDVAPYPVPKPIAKTKAAPRPLVARPAPLPLGDADKSKSTSSLRTDRVYFSFFEK